ncbi:MAG: thiamine diphosphokinase [Desulfobacteraceae bacterium]|nr:thiamine diphosphokinase [Desulfobacteraceae bacterium]
MKCVIIANGSLGPKDVFKKIVSRAQLIVCADGGGRHLKDMGIFPDVLIGDFDSLCASDKAFFEKKNIPFIPFNPKKDQTDTDLAISWALENGASDITLIAATGTRLDHTLCNIFLLKRLVDGKIPCRIIDAHNEIYLLTDQLTISGKPGDLLSIIPVSKKVCGVTIEGLEYPLSDADIEMGSSLGTSNCFLKDTAVISIKKGVLLVIKSKD